MPSGVQPREWCGQIPEWRSRISGAPIRRPAGPATGAWKERLMAAVNETIEQVESVTREKYKYGFVTSIEQETAPKGLNEDIIRFISAKKGEPEWMLEWRLDRKSTRLNYSH